MKIAAQTNYIRDSVAAWAAANNGKGEVARNMIHWFGVLATAPGGFRFAVKFKGEGKRGEFEEASMFDRKFWIGFSYGQSLQLEKGDALTKGQAGGRPLFDLVEELRDVIRGFQFDPNTTEVSPNYTGAHELIEAAPDWAMIDGFYLEFTIGTIAHLPTVQTEEGD